MRISDIVSMAFDGAASRLRRDAIGYATAAACGVAVAILSASASVLALEPEVGAVYARLIVAGAFVLIAASAVVWVKVANNRRRQPAPSALRAADTKRGAQFAQIAMIVEAVLLGYSLSRRTDRR